MIARRPPPPPASWRFSPDGHHVAAELPEGCGIWSAQTGHFGGVLPDEGPPAPCTDWTAIVELGAGSPPGPGSQTVARAGCTPDAVASSPHGTFVAIGCLDAKHVELWGVQGNAAIAELPIRAANAHAIDLVWGDAGLALVLASPNGRGESEFGLLFASSATEAALSASTGKQVLDWSFWGPSRTSDDRLVAAYADPYQRWVWLRVHPGTLDQPRDRSWTLDMREVPNPDDGSSATSGMSWVEGSRSGATSSDEGWRRTRAWSGASTIAWVELQDLTRVMTDDGELHELLWQMIVPHAGQDGAMYRSGEVFRVPVLEPEVRVLGGGHQAPRLATRACGRGRDEASVCRREPARDESCAFEVPSGDSLAVLRCPGAGGERWSVLSLDEGARVDIGGGSRDAVEWILGERGGLVWSRSDGVRVVDEHAREGARLPVSGPLLRATLDAELGLALARDGHELVVLDLRGEVLGRARVAPGPAAFDPSGKLLALLAEGHVVVVEIDSGQTRANWLVELEGDGPVQLAWRQDSGALFLGSASAGPRLAWSPDGQPDTDAERRLAALPTTLSFDPSWRWAFGDSGGAAVTFWRTLDAAWLWLLPTEGSVDAVASNGYHVDLPSAGQFSLRPRGKPLGPLLGLDALPELHREDLIGSYFAGEPLPAVRIEPERLERLGIR
ncbi:hypothetical protein G6O69_31430 [Pseudenhygromyxa sp. WMMC2535]|uniref:hypothetical protein n=1 Tax=Pseudenhygromyxa sp. WMMC2535 TaxID=2712867 RepID=UPI00155811B1|nr:hypothetical protein [Pseudenhygromyxa sp. WMMC2535]NVB42377.1 hypothetical protein [Pseudenhygromyxa sp. WMMC2535]